MVPFYSHHFSNVPYSESIRRPIQISVSLCCCSVTQSCPTVCDHMNSSREASLSFSISQTLLKHLSLESVMPSYHLILCFLLLFLPSISPNIMVFSNELALHIMRPQYVSLISLQLYFHIVFHYDRY